MAVRFKRVSTRILDASRLRDQRGVAARVQSAVVDASFGTNAGAPYRGDRSSQMGDWARRCAAVNRTPTHLKLVKGNPGRRPLPTSEPKPRGKPTCPAWLSIEAKREWRRMAVEMHALGLLTSIDRSVFAAYCESVAVLVRATKGMNAMAALDPASHGGLVVIAASGNAMQNPLVMTARQAKADMVRYAAEFGMSPSAQTRIKAIESEPDEDAAAAYF